MLIAWAKLVLIHPLGTKAAACQSTNANGSAMGLDEDVCRPHFLVKQAKQASDVVIELLTVGERV